MLLERGIDFHKAVVNGLTVRIIEHFDNAKTFIDLLEQCPIPFLARHQVILRPLLPGDVHEDHDSRRNLPMPDRFDRNPANDSSFGILE